MYKSVCYSANLPMKIQGFVRYSAATPPLLRRLPRRKPYETWVFVTKTHGLLRDPWRVTACDVCALLGRNAIHPVFSKLNSIRDGEGSAIGHACRELTTGDIHSSV